MSTTQQTQTKSKRNIGKKQRRRKLQLRTKHRRTVRSKPLIGISKSSKKNNNKESISTTKQNSNNNDVNGIKQTENKITTSIIKTTSTTTTETASSSSTISSTAISSTSIGHKTMINKTLRKKKKKGQLGINKAQLKRQKNARDDKKKQKDKKQIADDIDIDKKQKLGKHKIYIHNKQKEREKDSGLLKINGNIEQFKSLKVNQILEIRHLETNKTLTLKISKIEKSGATNWSLSIDSEIAMIFNLNKSMNCDIYLINALSLELLQIEITFKNQYISRGKQWKIETDLINRIVHINENIKNNKKGYDINVKCCKSLKKDGEIVSCGLITRKTKFLWRSNSAWFIYLVQLSKEMWDFSGNDDDGKQIHFEKFIDGFLKTVMAKWKKNQCQHVYSIIFFSRTFYENDDVKNMNASPNTKQRNNHFTYNGTNINGKNINGKTAKVFNLDSDNRYYQDHYMVVVRNWTGNDWNKLSRKLREAFDTFPMKVKWKRGENIEKNGKTGNISVAAEGNLLQAIQLSLNVLDKHYIDRDLHRTGMSITVVTAGNGLYFVDKSLATFTKVRILNNGINCDIVSMSKPPIHPTPLFVYGSPLAFEENKWQNLSYSQPTEMMQIKFFDYNPYNESPLVPPKKLFTQTASFLTIKNLAKSFVPLSLGDPPQNEDIDNNSPGNGVVNIYLQNDAQNLDSINLNQDYDDYDDQIFNPICHSSLINTGNKNSNNLNITDIPINMKRRKSSSKTKKYEEEIIPKQLLEQSSSISNHNNHNNHNHHNHHSHHHHHALISKRTLRNFSDTDLIKKNNQAAKLAKRMFSIIDIDKSNKRANLSEEDDEENNADDGDKPTLRNLKTMFNASMEDGENINDDNQVPDVKYSTKESTAVIVIQHKDSYHQMNSIKNTDLSALDPICNTPLNGPVAHNETNKIDIISKINDHLLTENQSGTDVDSDYYKDKRRNNTIIRNTIHPFKTKWNEYDNFNVLNLRNKRFGQMYPLPYQYCGFLFPQFKQQWTTFVSPAILPLRNDIEFKQNAMEASKNVYKADWQIGANNKYILNEMILQRLTQDFQLMKVIEHQQQIVNIKTHVLNTQTYIHKLSQTFPDPNITITRYVDDRLAKKENNILLLQNDKINEKNIDVYQQVVTAFSLIYNYNLWNDHREVFQNYSVKLAEQHQLYDWTKLDQVCAGYKNDIENDLKARRIRFAIIPSLSSNSCSYSTLIENFKKWFTTMTNTKNISESGIKINNKDPCYYDASQWTLESNDDNNNDDIDRSRIGFDSMNQILKAKRLIIKLESEWKGRNTFLIIKYDTIYDPNVVFHLQIYWLIATGYQISKFVDSIKRSAKSLSLHLINVPSAQPQKIADPFSKTLTVEAKDGKLLNKTVSIHLQNALISLFNFSLDTNYPNRKQLYFMHNDGCCIVRWNDGKGFTWVPNNAKTADNTQSDFIRSQSIKLFQDFRRYFHDTILKYQHANDILNNIIQSI